MTLGFLQNIGPMELIIIFFVVLIFFGAKRLPGLFSSFGKSIREFKKATQDIEDDIQTAMNAEPKKVNTPQQSVAQPDPAAEPQAEKEKAAQS